MNLAFELTEVDSGYRVPAAMERRLNVEVIAERMRSAGLNAAKLAGKLEVSREAVSKWLNAEATPRPDKLLKLALLLGLRHDELMAPLPEANRPVVAFRKKGNHKITAGYLRQAERKGLLLRQLVPFLPFDKLMAPETLKQPATDYPYLQAAAGTVRKRMGVAPDARLEVAHLVACLRLHQAVIVPVLWGQKEKHENALHIFLPESTTTWIFLNLDTQRQHFRFWMAHELGHVLSPALRGDEAEDFADAFAGALLVPEPLAARVLDSVGEARTRAEKLAAIREAAEALGVSPYTVYLQMQAYAAHRGAVADNLEPDIFKVMKAAERADISVHDEMFGAGDVAPDTFIAHTGEAFGPEFWDAVRQHSIRTEDSQSLLRELTDLPLLDAKALHLALG